MDPDRVARAAEAISDGRAQVEPTGDGTFRVRSFTGDAEYTVQVQARECTCPDARFRGERLCKHMAAVALLRGLT